MSTRRCILNLLNSLTIFFNASLLTAGEKLLNLLPFGDFVRLARNKGANKAKVATARRLLTIIYKVLKEGRNYIAYRR
jgi:hypothetical protein